MGLINRLIEYFYSIGMEREDDSLNRYCQVELNIITMRSCYNKIIFEYISTRLLIQREIDEETVSLDPFILFVFPRDLSNISNGKIPSFE